MRATICGTPGIPPEEIRAAEGAPTLTGTGSLFDEPVPTFGRFQVTASLGEGRFGPVHLGVDPDTDQVVVIRTFTERLTPDQQQRLLQALEQLCARPLDHASIATPLACGLENDQPYLVHTYLPGTSVDEFLRSQGSRPLGDVAVRVTHLAAAVDFAAAAGVHHGALSPRDIIFASHSTGLSGFGLVQAMRDAGVDLQEPTRADDIYALAAMTFELLVGYRFAGGSVRDALAPLRGVAGIDHDALVAALEPVLSAEPEGWPDTALGFAASLHAAHIARSEARAVSSSRTSAPGIGRLSFGLDDTTSALSPAPAPSPASLSSSEPPSPFVPATSFADDAPAMTYASEPADDVTVAAEESRAQEDEPVFDAPLHAAAAADVPFADVPVDDLHIEPDPERAQPPDAMRFGGGEPQPVAVDAPVLASSVERASEGSGWRVFALAAALAVVVITTAALLFLKGGSESSPAASAEPPVEHVQDSEIVLPGSRPQASASAPEVGGGAAASLPDPTEPAPVLQETVPPRIAPRPVTQAAVTPDKAAPQKPSQAAPAATPRRESKPPAAHIETSAASRPTARATTPATQHVPAESRSSRAVESAEAMGRVLVRSTPAGARVLIDGSVRGQTPAAIRELSFGTHVIVVTAPGYPQWQQTVTLTPERPAQSFEVALDGPAATPSGGAGLQIDSRPSGARVWIDGTPAGVTPLMMSSIAIGSHMVRIELDGYQPWSGSVSVSTGERARVAASLER